MEIHIQLLVLSLPHCFLSNNCLAPLQGSIYRELTVVSMRKPQEETPKVPQMV